MLNKKNILKCIYTIIILIQMLLLKNLFMKIKPLKYEESNFLNVYKKISLIIIISFIFAIIYYIFEHNSYNIREKVFCDDMIEPNFDISFKNKDILYLSTILNQKYPSKKEIILLIMQLINKKVIDLSAYFDGNNYQYIMEKRSQTKLKLTNVENELLNYLFYNSNRVNLIDKIKDIYYHKDRRISVILKKCNDYIQPLIPLTSNPRKKFYKKATYIISFFSSYLGFLFLTASPEVMSAFHSVIDAIIKIIFLSLLCIIVAFVFTLILKKFTQTYQYNNDTYAWICKNLIFLATCLLICYTFPAPHITSFITFIIYFLCELTIMIKYNEHISLSEDDIFVRNELISLKKYFQSMDYLKNKEFYNIITYEECITYGFLFNITIKINDEFDFLQKQLFDIINTERNLFVKLFISPM